MKITQHKTDFPGKENIASYLLQHDSGASVTITNYGAIITSLLVRDRNNMFHDIVLGFDHLEEYTGKTYRSAYPYFGAVLGRYANRVKNGQFTLDGKKYQLPVNLGNDTLHGGPEGFDSKVWTVEDMGETPEPYIVLSYLSPDGECGFPGNLSVTVIYELNENGLTWRLNAESDAPTIFNPAQHTYFNLNGGKGTIDNHRVKLYADKWMEQDEAMNPTGKLLPVTGTPFDFTEKKPLNRHWNEAKGYDQSFIINEYDGSLKLCAEAENETASLGLQVFTTEPVVHLYTGRWIPGVTGKNGIAYGPSSGVCFETQHHPNAINLEGFPDTILRPGKRFTRTDRYLAF